MAFAVREEVLNVLLADLLSQRGLISVPESLRRSARDARAMPDITIADLSGVRLVLEGRIDAGPLTRRSLVRDAKRRIDEGICAVALAVLYPPPLRRTSSLDELRTRLAHSSLAVRVLSESEDGQWCATDVDGLCEILTRTQELAVSEDVVARAVEDLDLAMDQFSAAVSGNLGLVQRLAELLGISLSNGDIADDDAEKIARIAALTLTNAMVFQQILAARSRRVSPLMRAPRSRESEFFLFNWHAILEIDYVPIFKLATVTLEELAGTPAIDVQLRSLARTATRITARRAALRHDLMGRVYHRLLRDAKYFGAFYTTVPAATLISCLA